jgi:hypothetical protein
LAERDYLGHFQHCGQFLIDKLRWRVSKSGIVVRDLLMREHFQSFEEWRAAREKWRVARYGKDKRDEKVDDELQYLNDEEEYFDELEEGTWQIARVSFSLKLSFAALVTMVLKRAEHGLNGSKVVNDSQELQKWTDVFTLLSPNTERT